MWTELTFLLRAEQKELLTRRLTGEEAPVPVPTVSWALGALAPR